MEYSFIQVFEILLTLSTMRLGRWCSSLVASCDT